MRVGSLRDIIRKAFEHEEKTLTFRRHLESHLKQKIPGHIFVDGDDDALTLLRFAMEYVQQVPDFLDALRTAAKKASIEKHVFPFLKMAEDYFLSPPKLPNNHIGLLALMDEAYLAHRLFEEVNDRYISRVGLPLIPWDMTLANVVAHSLIGEELANQLDEMVHQVACQMMEQEKHYDSPVFKDYLQSQKGNTVSVWQEWPCLSQQMGISWGFSHAH